jgi:hypothetical protein
MSTSMGSLVGGVLATREDVELATIGETSGLGSELRASVRGSQVGLDAFPSIDMAEDFRTFGFSAAFLRLH